MAKKHKQVFAMSRRQRKALFVLSIMLVIVAIWLDRNHGLGFRADISERAKLGTEGWKYHGKIFSVVNVVDGDTLDLDIPDGKFDHTRVRLLGMDTPETKSPKVEEMYYGQEATQYAIEQAQGKQVTVMLDTVSDTRDMYQRLLAYIRLPDGRILNEELIKNGFAYTDLRFQHSHYNKYVKLQDQALEKNIGLWKEVKREQFPKWLQRERPDLLRED